MVKSDLVQRCIAATRRSENATRSPPDRDQVKLAVEAVFAGLADALAAGDRVEIRRFGVFAVRPRRTGIARNPRTNQAMAIPPGQVIRFRGGRDLSD